MAKPLKVWSGTEWVGVSSFTSDVSGGSASGTPLNIPNTLVSRSASGTFSIGAIEVSSSVTVTNLNADLLDNQQGSYYLDWTNITSKPSPIIGVNLTGAVTGAASATLTQLTNGQISITTATSGGGTGDLEIMVIMGGFY